MNVASLRLPLGNKPAALAGVTSWGQTGCGGITVFARVSHGATWILDTIGAPRDGRAERCDGGSCPARVGDCDGNAQCASGLLCTADVGARLGFSPAMDVCLPPPGHASFCSTDFLCNRGEGHCDSTSECSAGLSCARNAGPLFGFPQSVSVCMRPSDICTSTNPCGVGGGPCDNDFECRGGICTFSAAHGHGVCQPDPDFDLRCVVLHSCGPGEGPCRSDVECEPGLECLRDLRKGYNTCQGTPLGPEIIDLDP
ncbi:hypothetical protein [Sorangium sp. So ce131]|uniref:hypothetical protein n=1 Tax=Sorangium sp. So ce131 TaxID=3133282 RepID=UPI003F622D1B